MTDCLMAKVTPYVTDCVVAELEKLGPKYRVALRIAQQLERLPCQHKGTYADDCIVNRIKAHKVFSNFHIQKVIVILVFYRGNV